jgi:hypothetical protein
MPTPTYVAISKVVLTGSQATITFSGIPSSYTDLLLSISARSDRAASLVDTITYNFNSATTNFSNNRLEGTGASASATLNTTNTSLIRVTASSVTSNTFTSAELYIPNYTGSANKPLSSTFAYENNATTAYVGGVAGLWSNTSAITSITLGLVDGPNFVSGSRFDLYGIKNS